MRTYVWLTTRLRRCVNKWIPSRQTSCPINYTLLLFNSSDNCNFIDLSITKPSVLQRARDEDSEKGYAIVAEADDKGRGWELTTTTLKLWEAWVIWVGDLFGK